MRTETLPDAKIVVCIPAWDTIQPYTATQIVQLCCAKLTKRVILFQAGKQHVMEKTGDEDNLIATVILQCNTLLPQARNDLIRQAYQEVPDLTHVLFIDQDMADFSVKTIRKLLERDVDMICPLMIQRWPPFGVCANPMTLGEKNPEYRKSVALEKLYDSLQDQETDGVLPCSHIGTGFTLIKRKVLEALRDDTDMGPVWFTMDRLPRPEAKEELKELVLATVDGDLPDEADMNVWIAGALAEAYDLGRKAHIGMAMMGEDVLFCHRARHLGFQPWLDTNCSVSHIGVHVWNMRDQIRVLEEYRKEREKLGIPIGNIGVNPTIPMEAMQ